MNEALGRAATRREEPERAQPAPTLAIYAAIAGLVGFLYAVRPILLPFVVGAIVAFVCAPLIDWLCRRTGLPRVFWAILTLVVLLAVAGLGVFLAGPSFAHEAGAVIAHMRDTLARFVREFVGSRDFTALGHKVDADVIASSIVDALRNYLVQGARMLKFATLAFAIAFGFIVTVVITGYLLNDVHEIGRDALKLAPPRYRSFILAVWRDLEPVLRRYFVGVALIVLYASIVAYVGLGLILHVKESAFLAVMTGVLEIVPLVGPAASAVIAGLFAVQQAASSAAIIGYVIYAAVLRISIDQFFGPFVLGRAAYVRPVVVIFCLFAGGVLFGIIGVVLAVPVAVTIRATLARLYAEDGSAVAFAGDRAGTGDAK